MFALGFRYTGVRYEGVVVYRVPLYNASIVSYERLPVLTKRDGGVELLSGRCCLITSSVSRLATIPENVSAGSFGAYVFE